MQFLRGMLCLGVVLVAHGIFIIKISQLPQLSRTVFSGTKFPVMQITPVSSQMMQEKAWEEPTLPQELPHANQINGLQQAQAITQGLMESEILPD